VPGRHALGRRSDPGSGALGQVLDLVRLDLDLHGCALAGRAADRGDDPPEARTALWLVERSCAPEPATA
jgi:hypothetical protein